jgi:hypothetical protein
MGHQTNYGARAFTRRTKSVAFILAKDKGGVAHCRKCTAPVTSGNVEYDHVEPWEFSRHSGPRNCQVLCKNCHARKTAECDVPMIRASDRVRDRHINAITAQHPLPAGRRSGITRPIGSGGPRKRKTQGELLRELREAKALVADDGTLVGAWVQP